MPQVNDYSWIFVSLFLLILLGFLLIILNFSNFSNSLYFNFSFNLKKFLHF